MAVGDLVRSGQSRSGEWASAINRIANMGGISAIGTGTTAAGATATAAGVNEIINRLNAMKSDSYWSTQPFYSNIPGGVSAGQIIAEGTRSGIQATINNINRIVCRNIFTYYYTVGCGNGCNQSTCGNGCNQSTCGNGCNQSTCQHGCHQSTCSKNVGKCDVFTCPATCLSGGGCYKGYYYSWTCYGFYCTAACNHGCNQSTCSNGCNQSTCGNGCNQSTCQNGCHQSTCSNSYTARGTEIRILCSQSS